MLFWNSFFQSISFDYLLYEQYIVQCTYINKYTCIWRRNLVYFGHRRTPVCWQWLRLSAPLGDRYLYSTTLLFLPHYFDVYFSVPLQSLLDLIWFTFKACHSYRVFLVHMLLYTICCFSVSCTSSSQQNCIIIAIENPDQL